MRDMIEKKAEELRNMMPDNPEFKNWLEQSNLWYWLYFDMNLQSIKVAKRQVVEVLAGRILEDTSMEVYGYIHRFAGIYKDMKAYLQMENSLTLAMLDSWCEELFPPKEQATGVRRSSNSPIYEWGHIPPHFKEIEPLMSELLRSRSRGRFPGDRIDRMLEIYVGILSIYPYGEHTRSVAGLALVYSLLEEGFPLPGLPVGEQEYNRLVAEYLENSDMEPLKNMLQRSVYNRLEAVVQLAAEAAENKDNERH